MFLLHFLKSDVYSQPWCREPDPAHSLHGSNWCLCQFSMSRSCVYIPRKAEPLLLKFSTGMDNPYYFPMSFFLIDLFLLEYS